MSLVGKTAWVVGGVGIVGRGITRGLLQAGATVIVNSRSEERLESLKESLDHPERLKAYVGSLLPHQAAETVRKVMKEHSDTLHHVVSHGAVRWWARPSSTSGPSCDESYSLPQMRPTQKLLDQSPNDFLHNSAQLASLHFSALQQLVPFLQEHYSSSLTFVTGDGSHHPNGKRSSLGEINSHHMWGLSAALRQEMTTSPPQSTGNNSNDNNNAKNTYNVTVREVRVGGVLPVVQDNNNNSQEGSLPNVSEYIGDLCAGLAAAPHRDAGKLLNLERLEDLQEWLDLYNVNVDERVGPLPSYMCEQGYFTGSL